MFVRARRLPLLVRRYIARTSVTIRRNAHAGNKLQTYRAIGISGQISVPSLEVMGKGVLSYLCVDSQVFQDCSIHRRRHHRRSGGLHFDTNVVPLDLLQYAFDDKEPQRRETVASCFVVSYAAMAVTFTYSAVMQASTRRNK